MSLPSKTEYQKYQGKQQLHQGAKMLKAIEIIDQKSKPGEVIMVPETNAAPLRREPLLVKK